MGLAWAVCAPMWVSGQGLAHPLSQVLMAAMMFTPTLATLAVVFLGGRPKSVPRLLGLGPIRPAGRTLGMTALSLGLLCVLPFLAALLGGALGLVQLDLANFSAAAAQIEALGVPGMDAQTYVLVNVLAVPVNAVISSLAAFGEELGWRGWLLPNLLPLGRWPALLLSSVIWALWHAPIILLGYNFGYTDARGLALMTGFCLGLGMFLGWLRLRTASVWPAVVGHGAVNAATAATLLLLHADQLADTAQIGIGTFLGLPGWALMAVLIVVLVVTGQFRKQAEPGVPVGR
ncbi:MAG TPA: CPBP family intramembrane metalloprotease [Candidatus Ruania gallistercoris]|uniref:CPBP family intramembrane metalloprotease n=1 Tax=Candidatus Ruania gallistercoris TaxID=2838746 RepID=A0A9D2EG12_9MICO|nr:CPBP family intramembrane metalloprotease [Candidatus Ruania gallistercoris]